MPPASPVDSSAVDSAPPSRAGREDRTAQDRTAQDRTVGTATAAPTTSRATDSDARLVPVVDPRVGVAEIITLGLTTVIGVVALVALVAGHLRHATLPITFVGAAIVLLLAVALVLRYDRPQLRLDAVQLAPVGFGIILASFMMFPGFQYGTGDRDPGAYIEHAVAIARTHSVSFEYDGLANHLPGLVSPGAVWPALWIDPHDSSRIFPQFYHLWPSLLATAKQTGGYTGLFNTTPLLGVVCVALAACLGRRLAGWPGAWTAAALLSTNMLEVWQAKYPTAEIFGQMLFLGALLATTVAIRTGWRTAAGLGGFLVGLSYLERADAIIIVLMSWAALCALVAVRRVDARVGWFAVGLVVLLPYGFFQAYYLADFYTRANSVPAFSRVLAVMVLLGVVAAVGFFWAAPRRFLLTVGDRDRTQRIVGGAFLLGCAVLLLIGGFRGRLFGADYQIGSKGLPVRTYDEISLIRLSWFFSLTGLGLMVVGLAYVALRRWRLDLWLLALPAAALLTLYCFHLRNSPYMMWSTRRFVTTVVPGIVLLIGCGIALAVLVIRRFLPRAVAVAAVAIALVGLSTFYLSQSLPLRHHDENSGAVEVVQQLAKLSGDQHGIYLWARSGGCCAAPYQLFGGPLLAVEGQTSAVLSTDPQLADQAVEQYLAFAKAQNRPLFFISRLDDKAPNFPGTTAEPVKEMAGSLPHWQETFTSRPKKPADYHYGIRVYSLTSG